METEYDRSDDERTTTTTTLVKTDIARMLAAIQVIEGIPSEQLLDPILRGPVERLYEHALKIAAAQLALIGLDDEADGLGEASAPRTLTGFPSGA